MSHTLSSLSNPNRERMMSIVHHLSAVADELNELDISLTRMDAGRELARLIDDGALVTDSRTLTELGTTHEDVDRLVQTAMGRICK